MFKFQDLFLIIPLAVFSAAILLYIRKAVFGGIFGRGAKYKVSEIKNLNDQIMQMRLAPEGKPIKYLPGQYVYASFQNSQPKPFSLISSPNDRDLMLSIKSLGYITSKLKDLPIGAKVRVRGPYGNFVFTNIPGKDQIWVAGGIGITPFISMSKFFVQEPKISKNYKIRLFYCANTSSKAVYFEELNKIAAQNENFRIIPFFTDKCGLITAKKIDELSGGLNGKEILMCGSPAMLDSLRKQLFTMRAFNYGNF